MKKVLMSAAFIFIAVVAINAQETKTKPVTTPADKAHNVTHHHNKVSHGTKSKHKTAEGKKTVTTDKTSKEALEPKKKEEVKH